MTVNNVSTYGSLQTLLQNMSQSQNSLNTDEEQISSGEVSQTFDGLSGNVEQFTSLNAQISRLQNYQQNNSTYVSQLQTTNTILGQVQTLATSAQTLIQSMSSQLTPSTSASFIQQLKSDLSTLAGQLNTTYSGNYLFGGTNTDTAPVTTPVPSSNVIGTPDDSYYQGSTQTSTVRIADGQSVTNGVTAADPAFQSIIAGINQAISVATNLAGSTPDTTEVAALGNAGSLVNTGKSGVIGLDSTVNANIVTVQGVDTQSQTIQTYYQGITQNISQSDVVALSTKVAQDQSVLEASFETFARISSLTLSSYLK